MTVFPSQATARFSCLKPTDSEYRRLAQLPGLLKLWPGQVDDFSYPGTLKVVALLRNALRAERRRARGGNWGYDLNRHMALLDALRHERAYLEMLERGLPVREAPAKPRLAGTLRLPCLEKSVAEPVSLGS
jgi:hypothetical protein